MISVSASGLIDDARKVFSLVERHYRGQIVLMLVVTIFASLLDVVSITAILPIFQLMLDPERITRIAWFQREFGNIPVGTFVLWTCFGVLGLFIVKFAVSLFGQWLKWHLQSRLYQSLGTRLLRSYLDSPLSFHLRHGPSELLRNLNSYVAQTTQFGFLGLVDLVSDMLLSIGIFFALIWVEPVVSIVTVAGLGAVATIYLKLGQSYFLRLGARYREASKRVLKSATEPMIGIKTVKILGRERYFEDAYYRNLAEYCDIMVKNSLVGAVPRQVLELIAVGALVGAIVWSMLEGRETAALVPLLAVFAAAAYRIMPAIVRITANLQNLSFAHEGIDEVHKGICEIRARPSNTWSSGPSRSTARSCSRMRYSATMVSCSRRLIGSIWLFEAGRQ